MGFQFFGPRTLLPESAQPKASKKAKAKAEPKTPDPPQDVKGSGGGGKEPPAPALPKAKAKGKAIADPKGQKRGSEQAATEPSSSKKAK